MQQTVRNFRKQLMKKRMEKYQKAATDNLKQGEEFLAKNKQKSGVVTLPSGLQYRVLEKGNIEPPVEQ